jgi:hypothetical protein
MPLLFNLRPVSPFEDTDGDREPDADEDAVTRVSEDGLPRPHLTLVMPDDEDSGTCDPASRADGDAAIEILVASEEHREPYHSEEPCEAVSEAAGALRAISANAAGESAGTHASRPAADVAPAALETAMDEEKAVLQFSFSRIEACRSAESIAPATEAIEADAESVIAWSGGDAVEWSNGQDPDAGQLVAVAAACDSPARGADDSDDSSGVLLTDVALTRDGVAAAAPAARLPMRIGLGRRIDSAIRSRVAGALSDGPWRLGRGAGPRDASDAHDFRWRNVWTTAGLTAIGGSMFVMLFRAAFS